MVSPILFAPDMFVHDWDGESAPYEWKMEIMEIIVANVS